jgi:hypothetical protein
MSAQEKIDELVKLFEYVRDCINIVAYETIPKDVLENSKNTSRFIYSEADTEISAIKDRNIQKFLDATKAVASESKVDEIFEWLTNFIRKSVNKEDLVSLDKSIDKLVVTTFPAIVKSTNQYAYWSEIFGRVWYFKLTDIKQQGIHRFVSDNYSDGNDPLSILSIQISDRLKQLEINEEMDKLGLKDFRELVDLYFEYYKTFNGSLTMSERNTEPLHKTVDNILEKIDSVLKTEENKQDKIKLMESYISSNPIFHKNEEYIVDKRFTKVNGGMHRVITLLKNLQNTKARSLIGGRRKTKTKTNTKIKIKKRTRKTRRIR